MNTTLKRWLRWIAFLIILIFGIVFTLLNPGLVELNFVFRSFEVPLSLLIFIFFAIGMILGLMIGYAHAWWRWFHRAPAKSVRDRMSQSEPY